MPNPNVALVILTWNAEPFIERLFASIAKQTLQPNHILVIDSSSTDNTRERLRQHPVQIHTIPQNEFDHGVTRRLATQLIDADIYIYMTHDVIIASTEAFTHIVNALWRNSKAGCAYGRQLPHTDANPLAAHLRLFNYPNTSHIRDMTQIQQYGIKTCFNSDSFSAYKKDALISIGNFPNAILGEDVMVAAKMLLQNWHIHYVAEATVHHSHNFNCLQEFRRYFSIGTFHRRESWIITTFKAPTGEGLKYILSEIKYLTKTKQFLWLPQAVFSWIAKFLGYKIGLHEKALPQKLKALFQYK